MRVDASENPPQEEDSSDHSESPTAPGRRATSPALTPPPVVAQPSKPKPPAGAATKVPAAKTTAGRSKTTPPTPPATQATASSTTASKAKEPVKRKKRTHTIPAAIAANAGARDPSDVNRQSEVSTHQAVTGSSGATGANQKASGVVGGVASRPQPQRRAKKTTDDATGRDPFNMSKPVTSQKAIAESTEPASGDETASDRVVHGDKSAEDGDGVNQDANTPEGSQPKTVNKKKRKKAAEENEQLILNTKRVRKKKTDDDFISYNKAVT